MVTFKSPTYGSYAYPVWANVIGWLIIASGLVGIPVLAVLAVVKNKCNIVAVIDLILLLSFVQAGKSW